MAVTSSGFDAHDYYGIVGTIDTLKPHPTTPVPDPGSTLLLLSMGLAGLRACGKWWRCQ